MNESLTSASVTETLDRDGLIWYIDTSQIDFENLTLENEDASE